MRQADNIIIGAGPGGYELAGMLAARGESVILIERDREGGTCLNRGCIPTKCLAVTAETAETCRRAAEFGIMCGDVGVDYAAAKARMDGVIDTLRQGIASLLRNVEIVRGSARLCTDRCVDVGGEIFHAGKRIVIATGSSPATLPVEGASLAMTSDDVLALDSLPSSAVIIGGGVIGLEFASIWSALGVDVTVVEFCKEILPPFDPEIAKRLRTMLTRRGIRFAVSTAVKEIVRNDDGLKVIADGKRGQVEFSAESVIMAVGRRPVVPDGCKSAGVEIGPRGFIKVDNMMQTTSPGIYAIGDCNGLCMLAHAASAQARVVADGNPDAFDAGCIPSVVFTMPEAASVGPTPEVLEAKGIETTVVKRSFASLGKAQAMGEADGVVKIVKAKDDGRVLAVSIIGPHASDLVAEATAMVAGRDTSFVHAHPTLSEIFVD
ncbi:MAG: dihydrolipoyl dehydrogenase [Bacteroidales bacterium]|nr:dihydrolipoyl dehydrogenase [Bacteroidales bacterium]